MIGILQYGSGNIASLSRTLHELKYEFKLVTGAADLRDVSALIFPGVGSFDFVIDAFNKSGLRDIVEKEVVKYGLPIFGICVGMQIMAERSEEGSLTGLGWLPNSHVERFNNAENSILRVPHLGWNKLVHVRSKSVFSGISDEDEFYFLHSYKLCCNDEHIIASTCYEEVFPSAIQINNNIIAVQFHPEKSHNQGLKVVKNILDYVNA